MCLNKNGRHSLNSTNTHVYSIKISRMQTCQHFFHNNNIKQKLVWDKKFGI